MERLRSLQSEFYSSDWISRGNELPVDRGSFHGLIITNWYGFSGNGHGEHREPVITALSC